MSVLLFGGSFDPFHVGHLTLLNTLRQFPGISAIEILPNALSPGKVHAATPFHRQAMLEAVIRTHFGDVSELPSVRLNLTEISSTGPHYTLDTITRLQPMHPALSFVIGWDQWIQFEHWKSPQALLEMLDTLYVVNRPLGSPDFPASLHPWISKVQFIEMPECPVASIQIRQRVASQGDIAGLVPDCVARYIDAHRLYSSAPFVLGITGRVGSGKSYAADILAAHWQAPILDLDLIGHEILQRPAVQAELVRAFSADILDEAGAISRPLLGEKVFGSAEALATLNQIVHPPLTARVLAQLSSSTSSCVILVGALIQDLGLMPHCHFVVTVDAEDASILSRSKAKFERISPLQRSRLDYQHDAHLVLSNPFTPEFAAQLIQALDSVRL